MPRRAPLELHVVTALTGMYRQAGSAVLDGVRAGIEGNSASIEDLGLIIRLREHNDACNNRRARAIAREICAERPRAVIGHLCSEATAAALPVYEESQTPLLIPAATSSMLKLSAARGLFRVCSDERLQAKALADLCDSLYPSRPLVLLEEPGPFGSAQANIYKQVLGSRFKRHVRLNGTDDLRGVTRCLRPDDEVLVYAGHDTDAVGRLLDALSTHPSGTELILGEAGGNVAPAADRRIRMRYVVPQVRQGTPSGSADGGRSDSFTRYRALGYAAVSVLASALAQSGAVGDLASAIAASSVETPVGDLWFAADGGARGHRFRVVEAG